MDALQPSKQHYIKTPSPIAHLDLKNERTQVLAL